MIEDAEPHADLSGRAMLDTERHASRPLHVEVVACANHARRRQLPFRAVGKRIGKAGVPHDEITLSLTVEAERLLEPAAAPAVHLSQRRSSNVAQT